MPKAKAASKRKAKQRDEEETLEAAPAESPARSASRATRSTVHLDDLSIVLILMTTADAVERVKLEVF